MDSDDSDIEGDGSAQNWDNVDCEEAFWNGMFDCSRNYVIRVAGDMRDSWAIC